MEIKSRPTCCWVLITNHEAEHFNGSFLVHYIPYGTLNYYLLVFYQKLILKKKTFDPFSSNFFDPIVYAMAGRTREKLQAKNQD